MSNQPMRRLVLLILSSLLLLSSCDLTVRIHTEVSDDGSGEFSLAVELDRELVEALAQTGEAAAGVSSLDELFAALAAEGWLTTRSEPRGGLSLRARRPFTDPTDFGRALAELGGAGAAEKQPLDLGGSLVLDYDVQDSLLRSGATFDGSIDLTFGEDPSPLLVELEDLLRQRVHFEIAARLPGGVTIREGGGRVEGETVVWRPVIGQRTAFGATSSKIKATVLLAVLLPGLALLAIAAWFLMGIRRRTGDEDVLPNDGRTVVLDPVAVRDEPVAGVDSTSI